MTTVDKATGRYRGATVPALTLGDARRCVAKVGRAPRTTAIPVLPPDVDEATWLAARRPMLTASELAIALGRSPHGSPFSLWWQKQDGWENFRTPPMNIGTKVEGVIGEMFAEERPDLMVCRSGAGLWRDPVTDWLGCTLDFVATDGSGLVEPVDCKAYEGGEWGKAGSGDVPWHIRTQLLAQCEVMGAMRGHVARLGGGRFRIYTVEYDGHARDLMGLWLVDGGKFVTSLQVGTHPDVDEHEATTEALIRLYPGYEKDATREIPAELASRLRSLNAAVKREQTRLDEAKNEARLLLGTAGLGVDPGGRTVVARSVYKRHDYHVPAGVVDKLLIKSGGPDDDA